MPNPTGNPIPKNKIIRLKGKKLHDLKVRVWERDEWRCQGENCPGGTPLDRSPHHIILKSQGGSDTEENLITLCIYCHNKKHGIKVVGFEPDVPF